MLEIDVPVVLHPAVRRLGDLIGVVSVELRVHRRGRLQHNSKDVPLLYWSRVVGFPDLDDLDLALVGLTDVALVDEPWVARTLGCGHDRDERPRHRVRGVAGLLGETFE